MKLPKISLTTTVDPSDVLALRLSWQGNAACAGADTDLFMASYERGIPAQAVEVIRTYCLGCPVAERCRADADEAQSTGVFGGQYRTIKGTKYRVSDRHGRLVREESYTSGVEVPGDDAKGAELIPQGCMSSADAIERLGIKMDSLRRLTATYGVEPVQRNNGGKRHNYFAVEDIEMIAEGMVSIPDGAVTRDDAMRLLGLKPRSDSSWFWKILSDFGIRPIVGGTSWHQSAYSRDDIEKIIQARRVPDGCIDQSEAARIIGLSSSAHLRDVLRRFQVESAATIKSRKYYRREDIEGIKSRRKVRKMPAKPTPDGYVDRNEAASMLNVSPATLTRRLKQARIKGLLINNKAYFPRTDIEGLKRD